MTQPATTGALAAPPAHRPSRRRRTSAERTIGAGGAARDRNLELYLKEIARYKPLSTKEELRLAPLIKNGDTDALLTLVNANLRFVVSVAGAYANQGVPLIDLVNEGNIGMLKAAVRFDERKSFKFISYAVWWIRQSILQALANNSRIIRIPLSQVSVITRLYRTSRRLTQENRRDPSVAELAEATGLSEREVSRTLFAAGRHSSLDAPITSDFDQHNTRMDSLILPADSAFPESTDERCMEGSRSRVVDGLLAELCEREQLIVRCYYGVALDMPLTLDEIGRHLGITRERVRQIKEGALRKLRRSPKAALLSRLASHDAL